MDLWQVRIFLWAIRRRPIFSLLHNAVSNSFFSAMPHRLPGEDHFGEVRFGSFPQHTSLNRHH